MLSLALLAGSVMVAKLPTAGAAVPGCPCVLLIEVDGLEPKDVTRETTPFLWELAHPAEGELIENTRAGWTWQAPRSVMTAGTAANAGALLTGSYPEQHGVPADEFVADGITERLEHNPVDAEQIIAQTYESEFLTQTVAGDDEAGKEAAAFVGNPALSGLTNVDEIPNSLRWYPTNTDPESPPSPAYCDVPRRLPDDPEADPMDQEPRCSATDAVTTNRALEGLNGPDGSRVALTYMHLAELGVIKRRDGDLAPPDYAEAEEDSPAAEQSLPHALAQVDGAIAQFVQRYKDEAASPVTAPKWDDTFIFVVGSHGYETAPQVKRLPAPEGSAAPDLERYVEESGKLSYSPYGSMATIHASNGTPAEKQRELEAIATQLKQDGPVEAACRTLVQDSEEQCIKEVLYVRDGVLPSPSAGDAKSLSSTHPDWHLDHLGEGGVPSGASGELLVVTEPGWGAGRGLPTQQTEGDGGGNLPISDSPDSYLGVSGGPRNRAVAAIVNGPGGEQGVRQVPVDHYPVRQVADVGEFDSSPGDAEFDSVFAANADPTDDAGKPGHERQPETVDFAPTIAALLGIGLDSEQLSEDARFLQEAFLRELKFPELEAPPEEIVVEEPPPEPPPPEPEPEVIILPPPPVPEPPPPPKSWSYAGLVRNLRAAVGDKKGHVFPQVRRSADLSYLILRADFGKPLASVKLSFYRRQRTTRASSGARRTVVKTLASFAPFSIKRAKDAKLTLKVPEVFKPTHVGIVVQQARKLSGRDATIARRKKLPLFRAYGARKGGIYRIKNARRLHTVASAKTRR
jgi:hypothetical protein